MQNTSPKTDILEDAIQMLTEPSRNTKRKILTAFNYVFIIAITLHLTIQLIEFGHLPDPSRDLVIFPIIILINIISAIYNTRVLLDKRKPVSWMDKFTIWTSIGIALLLSILIVHTNINTATSILVDFGLSVIMIFIVGTVIGRNAAIIWFFITAISLFVAYKNVGSDFKYYLLTPEEVEVFNDKLTQMEPEALNRIEVLKEHDLAPLSIKLFVSVWFIFMTILFLAVYYESNMISKILRVIPSVIHKISTASQEKHRLENENMRMGLELDVAQRIQTTLLPHIEEVNHSSLVQIAARMDPATEVGGDFYEVLPQEDGSIILAIGDVTDHGLQSGLVMLMAQSTIRTILDTGDKNLSLSTALARINTVMYRNIRKRMEDTRNLTLCLARIQGQQIAISGQHESILKYNSASGTVEEYSTIDLGIYVGLIENIEQHVRELVLDFRQNDILLFYTDGLTEAENEQGEFFGEQRLIQLLQEYATLEVNEIMSRTYDKVYQFIGGRELLDDISLLIIKHK